jgi:hypothetical protein
MPTAAGSLVRAASHCAASTISFLAASSGNGYEARQKANAWDRTRIKACYEGGRRSIQRYHTEFFSHHIFVHGGFLSLAQLKILFSRESQDIDCAPMRLDP